MFASVNGAVIDGRRPIESIPIPPRVIKRYGPRAQPEPEGIPSAPTPRAAKFETKAKPTASEAEAIEAKTEVVETESPAEAEAVEAKAEVVETESPAEAEAVSTKAKIVETVATQSDPIIVKTEVVKPGAAKAIKPKS